MNGLDINRQATTPVRYPRSQRNHVLQCITSFPAGKMVPLAAIPLLREDQVRRGRARITFEMQETAEILMNPVRVNVRAYLVPWLAMERFEKSMDQLNRSYMGQPQVEGGDVVPFLEFHAMGTHGSNAVYQRLGLHGKETDQVNTMYLEAYNAIWNFRAKNRSAELGQRLRLDGTLAPAFWDHARFAHIKNDFDAAMMEGEVALNVVSGTALPVHGIGVSWAAPTHVLGADSVNASNGLVRTSTGTYPDKWSAADAASPNVVVALQDQASGLFPDVWAEFKTNGISVSLANLEMAKKMQAFAKLRQKYNGHDDEWIIDMLMDGLAIPDQALTQPILLSHKSTVFGQAKRYATDAGNLTESATNGATFVDLPLRMPRGQRLHTGGIIMVVAEVLPEQLFERQEDPFFHAKMLPEGVPDFPQAMRDSLDPQPVVYVKNGEIDTSHSYGNDVFGYAPLNWKWDYRAPKVGGRFYRPSVDATFDEDRQRFWAVETANPQLAEDFYICTNIHQKPFLNGGSEELGWLDVFDAVTLGNVVIEGETQFGPALIEASDDFEQVKEEVDDDRILSGQLPPGGPGAPG